MNYLSLARTNTPPVPIGIGISEAPSSGVSFSFVNVNASTQAMHLGPATIIGARQQTFMTNAVISIAVTQQNMDPLIEGTTIPIYRISALLDGGLTVEQVLEDFPSLTRSHVETAREYARHFPNHGRQYPPTSFKRALRDSGFGELARELEKLRGAGKLRGVRSRHKRIKRVGRAKAGRQLTSMGARPGLV